MGVSTNAVIFYGYCWDEETELIGGRVKEVVKGEWEEVVIRDRGGVNPWDAYNATGIDAIRDYHLRDKAGKEWCEQHRAALDEWYEKKRAVNAEYGCDIGRHCSGDCPMPYVFVIASEITARRGYPVGLTGHGLFVDQEWDGLLDKFVSDLGVEKPQSSPQWWLVSYWSN